MKPAGTQPENAEGQSIMSKRFATTSYTVLLIAQLGLSFSSYAGETVLSSAASQAASSSAKPAVTPEGKTLPKNVARARIVNRFYHGDKVYDKNGTAEDIGITHKAVANAYVLEYGFSDRLTLQLVMPQVIKNQSSFNEEKFRSSTKFREGYLVASARIIDELKKANLCHSDSQCHAFLDQHKSLPLPKLAYLPSGEEFYLEANTPIKPELEQVVVNQARPAEKGQTGMGDTEIGMLYSIYTSSTQQFSAGLGLRVPTGEYRKPSMALPIGSGFYEAGLRVDYDYSPLHGLWLSAQVQAEQALNSKQVKRVSMLDNQAFNLADPRDGGDEIANLGTLHRPHPTLIGMAKAAYGFGALTSLLNPLSVSTSLVSRRDSKTVLRSDASDASDEHSSAEETLPSSSRYFANFGVLVSGLPHRLPLELSYEIARPIAGSNTRIVDGYHEVSLKAYVLF